MKYLVMECHDAYAIVLDDEGRFLHVANLRYQVGDILTDVYPKDGRSIDDLLTDHSEELVTEDDLFEEKPFIKTEEQVEEKPRLTLVARTRRLVLAVASFLLLFTAGTNVHKTFFAAYGLVQMDINPSVQLSVSSKDYVTGVEGLNAEGLAISEGIRFRGKKVEEVTEALVESAIAKGYLAEGGRIKINARAEDDVWEASAEARIAQVLERYEEDYSIEIQIGDFPDPVDQDDDDLEDDDDTIVIPVAPIQETPADQPSKPSGSTSKPSRPSQQSSYDDDDDDDDWDDDWDDDDDDRKPSPRPPTSSKRNDDDDDDDDDDWDDWDDDDDDDDDD